MDNVFDLVTDFYTQDEEWNGVLRQKYAEGFLRQLAWRGENDDELVRRWDQLTMLCLYLGNSESFLGDLSCDDFIDCVAWCGRNVSEFHINYDNVEYFLRTMEELYGYLRSKNIITSADAPVLAHQRLVGDGRVLMLDERGNFLPGHENFAIHATEDLPAKIFLNIGERLQNLLEALRTFFSDQRFRKDIERAAFLYSGLLFAGAAEEKPGTEEYAQCFWDYFLFDYRLLENNKRPLQYFYDDICAGQFSQEGIVSRDVVEELLKAKLTLFSVETISEEGLYVCRDFLTGETYQLMLPIDDGMNTEEFLFLGHIFYNQSMVMNFVRGMLINKTARKRLYETLWKALQWFSVRSGGTAGWNEFISCNPMFLRHVALMYSAYIKLGGFNYETKITDYRPQPVDTNDKTTQLIDEMMRPYAFSAYDILLTQSMWSDFKAISKQEIHLPELWAAGAIKNFIDLNGVYNYDLPKIAEMCRNVPTAVLQNISGVMARALGIETHDPRYVNEEGLLLMLLS